MWLLTTEQWQKRDIGQENPTHFHHIFADAGFAIDFASPKGSSPPLDQRSHDLRDRDNHKFWETLI